MSDRFAQEITRSVLEEVRTVVAAVANDDPPVGPRRRLTGPFRIVAVRLPPPSDQGPPTTMVQEQGGHGPPTMVETEPEAEVQEAAGQQPEEEGEGLVGEIQ